MNKGFEQTPHQRKYKIANKHMKRNLTSFVIREMYIQTIKN